MLGGDVLRIVGVEGGSAEVVRVGPLRHHRGGFLRRGTRAVEERRGGRPDAVLVVRVRGRSRLRTDAIHDRRARHHIDRHGGVSRGRRLAAASRGSTILVTRLQADGIARGDIANGIARGDIADGIARGDIADGIARGDIAHAMARGHRSNRLGRAGAMDGVHFRPLLHDLDGVLADEGILLFCHASDHQHQKHGDVTFKTYEVDGGLGALRTSEFDEAENTTI